jgi:hypothetical protein
MKPTSKEVALVSFIFHLKIRKSKPNIDAPPLLTKIEDKYLYPVMKTE